MFSVICCILVLFLLMNPVVWCGREMLLNKPCLLPCIVYLLGFCICPATPTPSVWSEPYFLYSVDLLSICCPPWSSIMCFCHTLSTVPLCCFLQSCKQAEPAVGCNMIRLNQFFMLAIKMKTKTLNLFGKISTNCPCNSPNFTIFHHLLMGFYNWVVSHTIYVPNSKLRASQR